MIIGVQDVQRQGPECADGLSKMCKIRFSLCLW